MISFFKNIFKNLKSKIKIFKIKLFNKNNILKIDEKSFFVVLTWILTILVIISKPEAFINFFNNFRQASLISDITELSVSSYGIFNNKNYIMSEIKEEKVIEKTKVENNDYLLLDEFVNENIELEVFKSVPDMTIIENSSSLQRAFVGNVSILNYSYNRGINYSDLIKNSNIILTKKSDKILLYNTHTSESYANSLKYQFEYSGTRRTQDANYNMLRIAKSLKENLNEKGFEVLHDTTPHDYGSYTSAYAKSRITLENALNSYGGFGLTIDVHRDAIEDLEFSPEVNINGVIVSKLMFVIGAGSKDDPNPYFEDNLKLALKIQYLAEQVYPGLFRPMIIRNSKYNQDLSKFSLLVEVGASGNTIEEAESATRCLANLLNIIYKD